MLNKYPTWKNLLILFVVAMGVLYFIPNLYPDDPAIQFSNTEQPIAEADLVLVTNALRIAEIGYFGEEVDGDNALIRLASFDDQLRAKTVIDEVLNDDFIVALNLAPTTPGWLQAVGAGKMNLGLDLQGGVHFLMEIDMDSAIERRMENNLSSMRQQLREARIRCSVSIAATDLIEIRCADEDLRSRARSEMRLAYPELQVQNRTRGSVEVLEMRLLPASILQIERDTIQANKTALLNRVDSLGVSEPTVQQQGSNRIVIELPGVQDTVQAKNRLQRIATLEFHLEAELGASSTSYTNYLYEDREIRVDNTVILHGDRLNNAVSTLDPQTGQPQVSISLDGQGGQQISRVTRDNVGRLMDILLVETKSRIIQVRDENGEYVDEIEFYDVPKLISHATINQMLGRQFRITGLNSKEANELAILIRAGALAAPMVVVEERVVGPSMGQDNLDKGMLAVQISAVLIVLFMLALYRLFGLAANIALGVNIILIFALMSIIHATLTLPGIFGIVLTVGMAVDANVLIFTRIREELANGFSPQAAINAGFDRAFTTIFDANLTTFLVAAVLYLIGTGPVKGFAITLMLGIITSMFTAILGTRALINLYYGGRTVKHLSIGIKPQEPTATT